MSLDLRWLIPAAICVAAPQAYAAKFMTAEQARASIFPLADEFIAKPMQLTPDQMKEIDRVSGVEGRVPQLYVWQAMAKGKPMGWVFIDQVIGKKELITYAVGIDADGKVQQMQIIEYLEVYGSQVRYPAWRDQFVGKTVKSPLRLDNDIANISGATLSSRHVTDGIRRLLFVHQSFLR